MATDLNSFFIIGRLTRDVELGYTPGNNTALAKFSIANNEYRGQGKEEEVSYFDVIVWGKMAEVCNQFLSKGRQVAISGRMRQERFTDKQGQNRSKVVLVASNVQFIGGNPDNQNQQRGGQYNNGQSRQNYSHPPPPDDFVPPDDSNGYPSDWDA